MRLLQNKAVDVYCVDKNELNDWSQVPGSFRQIDLSDGYPSDLDYKSIDTVVHFAAESHVDNSIALPNDCIRNNVMATQYMLEYAERNVCRFLHISTDEVFGSIEPGVDPPFSLDSQYRPNSPYSASKAASDHMVRAYRHTFHLGAMTLNCANNYGPFQKSEKLIPTVIKSLMKKNPIPVYGDGQNVRDWIHVDDFCAAIWAALNSNFEHEQVLIGAQDARTNLELIGSIIEHYERLTGYRGCKELISFVEDRPGHDRCYLIDNSHARESLSWTPQKCVKNDMGSVVKWYLDNPTWVYEQ